MIWVTLGLLKILRLGPASLSPKPSGFQRLARNQLAQQDSTKLDCQGSAALLLSVAAQEINRRNVARTVQEQHCIIVADMSNP